MTRDEFERTQVPLWTVWEAREYYPRPYTDVFAYRYFDINKEEVAYFIPDMQAGFVFQSPRVYNASALLLLNLYRY